MISSDESFIILTRGTLSFEAELNLPYYPLLRRNVDCIIALDASADSQVRNVSIPETSPASTDACTCRICGLHVLKVRYHSGLVGSIAPSCILLSIRACC